MIFSSVHALGPPRTWYRQFHVYQASKMLGAHIKKVLMMLFVYKNIAGCCYYFGPGICLGFMFQVICIIGGHVVLSAGGL